MAFNKADKADAPMRKKGGMRRRKKVCVFCGKDNVIDYKDVNKLKRYVSERGTSRSTDALCSGLNFKRDRLSGRIIGFFIFETFSKYHPKE